MHNISKIIFLISIILILMPTEALSGITLDDTATPIVTSTISATTVVTPEKFRLAPSISLTSTKNAVEANDPAILTLSMINPSINDINLQVDVILKAPSGVYVTATSFASSGSNQNIGHFIVRPGEENHITIQITSTEIGEKAIESQVIYFPEGDKSDYHQLQQTMSIQIKEKSAIIFPNPIEPTVDNSQLQKDFVLINYPPIEKKENNSTLVIIGTISSIIFSIITLLYGPGNKERRNMIKEKINSIKLFLTYAPK